MDAPVSFVEREARRRRPWTTLIVLLLVAGLVGLGLWLALGGDRGRPTPGPVAPAAVAPAGPPPRAESYQPLDLKPLQPQEAVEINAAVPIEDRPITPATAFTLKPEAGVAYERALDCLTSAVYYEAASEADDGQRAVAQVVLNRMRHPAYPASVCGVVFQGWERATGCQFTFTCDGAIFRLPSDAGWARARKVAAAALAGGVHKPVGWSTHYHTNWVVPNWAASLSKTALVGTHIFYRWKGGWGERRSFGKRHAGEEPPQVLLAARYASHQPEVLGLPLIEAEPVADLATEVSGGNAEPRIPLAADEAVTPIAADAAVGTLLADRGAAPTKRPERRSGLSQAPERSAGACGTRLAGPAAPIKPSSADANVAGRPRTDC